MNDERFTNIYGTLYAGAIAVGCFYVVYSDWGYNPGSVIIFGFIGFAFACYSVGLFLIPLIDSFKKKK